MKDYLQDIVKNSFDLGCISAVKITGSDKETTLDAVADDKTVVISATLHAPVPDFMGLFGMPNLDKLKILLSLQEYRENAVLTVIHEDRFGNGKPEPVGIHFENAIGDFCNDYRFMTSDVVTETLKTAKPRKQPSWIIEFEPSVSAIQRLKMQAQANSDQPLFQVKTENHNLKFCFGDHSTHAGEFVFHAGVKGALTRSWSWSAHTVIAILSLAGNKMMKISDEGLAEITVDSGLATYRYTLPSQTK